MAKARIEPRNMIHQVIINHLVTLKATCTTSVQNKEGASEGISKHKKEGNPGKKLFPLQK